MVDPSTFGGRDIDVVSVPAQELVTYDPETPLSQEIRQNGEQPNKEIELPKSWTEEMSPDQAFQTAIGSEIRKLLSTGSEDEVDFNTDNFGVFVRAAYPDKDGPGDYRMLSEIFIPVDEYETENGVNETGAIAYEVQFSPKALDWQQNTQKEIFHYRETDRIDDKYVRDLLLDGLWEDEDRHMRPQWDSENAEPEYAGSITIDYSLPI